jgi:hypothetical protein
MPDPNLVSILAFGAFLVLGGLLDIGWRRRTEDAAPPGFDPAPAEPESLRQDL